MSDIELLELAAKAAGIHGDYTDRVQGCYECGDSYGPGIGSAMLWNPLHDDGDALRLAVKLGVTVRNDQGFACAYADTPNFMTQPPCEQYNENGGCRFAATRRAITRAAAEIGKGKQ